MMGERSNPVESEHGTRSFDRMECPKGAIDQIHVAGAGFELEQGLLELLQQFLGFLAEGIRGIVRHQPSTFFTTAMS